MLVIATGLADRDHPTEMPICRWFLSLAKLKGLRAPFLWPLRVALAEINQKRNIRHKIWTWRSPRGGDLAHVRQLP